MTKRKMSQTLGSALLDLLSDNNYHPIDDVADHLNRSNAVVAGVVHAVREKFLSGKISEYVHSTRRGYTINPKPEDLAGEARRRWRMGTSIVINGTPIYKQLKRLSGGGRFNTLAIEYKPKLIEMGKLMKK
jgi:hypothetical protein